ncbi:MAG: hypothetical protein ACW98X_14065 [Promethearchaeota archaeon]|jgi:hypothetical protein
MKVSLLKALGIFQFGLLVVYFILYSEFNQILIDSYFDLMTYEHYKWWIGYNGLSTFFLSALIFVSILFAFYSNLLKYIILNCFSSIYNLTVMSPFFFYNVPYFYCGMDGCAVLAVLLVTPTLLFIIFVISVLFKVVPNYREESKIRKEIIDLGTTIPHFKLKQVSRKCDVDKNTIKKVAKKMIKNKEIFAEYFNLSKKFVFNISANVEAIDNLMELYRIWEEEKIEKRVK